MFNYKIINSQIKVKESKRKKQVFYYRNGETEGKTKSNKQIYHFQFNSTKFQSFKEERQTFYYRKDKRKGMEISKYSIYYCFF